MFLQLVRMYFPSLYVAGVPIVNGLRDVNLNVNKLNLL
jgi:hypothetical protein